MRHIETYHRDEKEIKEILKYPKGNKERRQMFNIFRKSTNFDMYLSGITRPCRDKVENESTLYYPCVYCKGLYKKKYLKRHTKVCFVKNPNNTESKVWRNYISDSQTLAACALDPTNTISRLNVKDKVFI